MLLTTIIDITDDDLWMTMQLVKQLLRISNSSFGNSYCFTHNVTIFYYLHYAMYNCIFFVK